MPDLIVFTVVCVVGVLLLVQGIAVFYSGLTPPDSMLVQSAYSMIVLSLCALHFYAVGWSLTSSSGSALAHLVGSLKRAFFRDLPDNGVEYLARALLGLCFSAVSGALMIGAANQRGRFVPSLVFLCLWLTVVFDPVSFWVYSDAGWARRLGVLDYAGGAAVHCSAGLTALAYSAVLGPRAEPDAGAARMPSSLNSVVLGTFLMYVGFLAFNCGAAREPSLVALRALLSSQLAASAGGLTWMAIDYSLDGEWSLIGFCSGVISGFVCITPGAGFVSFNASLVFGLVGAAVCNLATKLKFSLQIDDSLDIFAVHGLGGLTGMLLVGVCAHPDLAPGHGALYGSLRQLGVQAVGAGAVAVYSFSASYLVLRGLDRVPGLALRVAPEAELCGLDISEHGEIGYRQHKAAHLGGQFPEQMSLESGLHRYKQTHMNASMFPGTEAEELPLLQAMHGDCNHRSYRF